MHCTMITIAIRYTLMVEGFSIYVLVLHQLEQLHFHGTCNPDFLTLSAGFLLNRHCTVKIDSTIGFS